ncbi:hypothetical protein C6341_g26874 [Phytophthora cactorum]|nr:hypothetical protein C6341_g26874 [Phytophthora cactorum]
MDRTHHCLSLCAELDDELHDIVSCTGIQTAGRLVKNEDARVRQQLDGDTQSTLLAARQPLAEDVSDQRITGRAQTHGVHDVFHADLDLVRRHGVG